MCAKWLKLIFTVSVIWKTGRCEAEDLSKSITFYGTNGKHEAFISNDNKDLTSVWCDINGKFAIITHGWMESCGTEHMVELIANLKRVRGGCILCMDYRIFSNTLNYASLVGKYADIEAVLVAKLRQLENEGFRPINGYMYGFSYGANLVMNAAIKAFGKKKFGMIDVTDPAGPLFDTTGLAPANASLAAKNVQCIHTSLNFGTSRRTCTQNWLMGWCGNYQKAFLLLKSSHDLAPVLYNRAFDLSFPAIKRPMYCPNTNRSLTNWPTGYKMGYDESRLVKNTQPTGTLYAYTGFLDPYNE